MKQTQIIIILLLLACIGLPAQEKWELKKNKNDVKVWTKDAPGWSLRQYRGVCLIKANVDSVYNFVVDWSKRTSWYADNTVCKVLKKWGETEFIVYYVYDAPWPIDNRDVVSKAVCSKEPNGTYLIRVSTIPNYLPLKKEYVRIERAQGSWKISQLDDNTTQVILEGKSDAGGEVPGWLANMFIEDNPFNSLTNLKKHFEVQ